MDLTPDKTISDVITDFLGSAPSLQEIVSYRLPDEFQTRAHALLDKNRSGTMSEEERAEIEEFRQIDHLVILLKAKARINLAR